MFAVLPDFDQILPILLNTFSKNHHQTLFHRPIIVVPTAIAIGWVIGGTMWAVIASICILMHFVHDTHGFSDDGIAWLWPFSEKYWSLQGSEDQHAHSIEHRTWIRENWQRPSMRSIAEIALSSLAVSAAFWMMSRSALEGTLLFASVWCAAYILWDLSSVAFRNAT
jgi:hypothetical protein